MTILNTISFLLDADSYKLSHKYAYPEGTNAMFSYIEARKPNQIIVPFGLQMWIKKNLMNPITFENIQLAQDIAVKHGMPFDTSDWEYLVSKYNGYIPFTIRGVPEGTLVNSLTPIVTVECDDSRLFWLASFVETSLQRGIWYPTTIASLDRISYEHLKKIYDLSSDNPTMLEFSLHSFASRGVSSRETAEIGGLAHLLYFRGTDDLVALVAAREYYNCDMAGYSVVATEHSVETSYGIDGAREYFDRLLEKFAKPGAIISAVMDGYDIYREVQLLCDEYRDRIVESGVKWVVRPDSGEPTEVIPRILNMLEAGFGVTINSKGYKVLKNVGIIQGDGINRRTFEELTIMVEQLGYAPECVIYGSGGGLLQNVNRDDFSFAQKTSAIRVRNEWRDTVKSPITDNGKRSKGGRLDHKLLIDYYKEGKLLVNDTLDTIRSRANSTILTI